MMWPQHPAAPIDAPRNRHTGKEARRRFSLIRRYGDDQVVMPESGAGPARRRPEPHV